MTLGINIRRLAFSVGVVGAIATPIATGSLKRAVPLSPAFYFEDDRDRFIQQRGLESWICLNLPLIINPDTRQTCLDAEAIPRSHATLKTSIRVDKLLWLLWQMLLGFIAPAAIVLLVPRMIRAYVRWLTTNPN